MKKIAAVFLLSAALLGTASAGARAKTADPPPINYGVADDTGKYANDGGAWFDSMLKGANLTEVRWTLSYNGDPNTITELPFIQRAAPQAQKDGVHVVLALYGRPASQHDASGFCAWAANVATTVKQWGIDDFIVWNEPNTSLYWSPQDSSTSPAAYEALLAQCYDSIHAADANARVIGFGLSPRSNGPGQTPPIPFILGVGAAYKASGRTAPIMDQMSIHPYPNPSSPTDSPDVGYKNTDFYGVPNLDRVKQAIWDAFHGTRQPTTMNGLTFRIDELGWQTDTSQYMQYYNQENVAVVSEQTQAAYVQEAVQKYLACDPTVTDVEWFLLVDEPTRNGKDQSGNTIGGGWQSGLLTAGGQGVSTPKVGYAADAPFFAAGRSACTSGMVNWQPAGAGGGSTGSSGGSSGSGESGGTGGSNSPTLLSDQGGLAALGVSQQTGQQLQGGLDTLQSQGSSGTPTLGAAQGDVNSLLSLLSGGYGGFRRSATLCATVVGFSGYGASSSSTLPLSLLSSGVNYGSRRCRRRRGRSRRAPLAALASQPIVVAAGSADVAAGAKPALTLKAINPKAKYGAGTYYVALVVASAADPTKKITLAVPIGTVAQPGTARGKGHGHGHGKGNANGNGKGNGKGGGKKP